MAIMAAPAAHLPDGRRSHHLDLLRFAAVLILVFGVLYTDSLGGGALAATLPELLLYKELDPPYYYKPPPLPPPSPPQPPPSPLPPPCTDDPSYGCAAWAGYDCLTARPAILATLLASCPDTCGTRGPCEPPAAPPPPRPSPASPAQDLLATLAGGSPAAYPLLFVLSGFATALRHSEQPSRQRVWPLLRARLAGYYPTYLSAALLSLLVAQGVRGVVLTGEYVLMAPFALGCWSTSLREANAANAHCWVAGHVQIRGPHLACHLYLSSF